MNSRPRRTVRNFMKTVPTDDSDFEDFEEFEESSEDEYRPTPHSKHSDSASHDEWSSSDSEEDMPLAEISRSVDKRLSEGDMVDSDDIPLAKLRKLTKADISQDSELEEISVRFQNGPKTQQNWVRKPFITPTCHYHGVFEEPPVDGAVASPYSFFRRLVTEDMFDMLERESNIYSMQKDGVEVNTTKKEIEIFVGIYLRMGLMKMPSIRCYWEAGTRFGPVADLMSRNRFEKLATYLHAKNNLTATNEEKEDKIWKLRPWLNKLRSNFLCIPAEENQSVDEIMVSFKGKSTLKQYIRGKPNPWGFKLWGRAGASGILYDFDVYQGKSGKKSDASIGVAGDVVLQLTETLPPGENYKIFADNFFTSLALIKALKERSLHYVGTVRSNRLKGCDFKSEKELKKEGRGSFDYMVEADSNIIAVRWYDNKCVDIVSSFIGTEPQGRVRRWDRTSKSYIQIDRPAIIDAYNSFMGGVDLLDSLTALYKQKMKSRRWYMYIFWHTIMISVVNSWLWYKRHCRLLHEKPMKLRVFVSEVATCLIEFKSRVGRPPLSPTTVVMSSSQQKGRPVDDIRSDRTNHFPLWDSKRQRCKFNNCTGFSFIKCVKCGLHFCLNKERNCFFSFHL